MKNLFKLLTGYDMPEIEWKIIDNLINHYNLTDNDVCRYLDMTHLSITDILSDIEVIIVDITLVHLINDLIYIDVNEDYLIVNYEVEEHSQKDILIIEEFVNYYNNLRKSLQETPQISQTPQFIK